MEGSCCIFWHPCRCRNCFVSQSPLKNIVFSLSVSTSLNLGLFNQICAVILTWCWPGSGSSPSRDIRIPDQSKSRCSFPRNALGIYIYNFYCLDQCFFSPFLISCFFSCVPTDIKLCDWSLLPKRCD